MSPLKVALVGGSGNLGPAVLKELLDAGFDVTVLTRSYTEKFDPRAKIAEVDYNSAASLTSALVGHQAVVNTLGTIAPAIHLRLIDSAIEAKVQRFIPSEFGSDTTNFRATQLPVYADKIAVQQHLKKAVQESSSNFSYTLLLNGPFLDWGLKTGFLINLKSPSAEIYDGGDRKVSTTTLSGVGKAVCGILENLDATKNKALFVREADVTQNQLLRLAGKEMIVESILTVDLERKAYEEMKKSSPNVLFFVISFIKRCIFGEGFGSHFPEEELSNDLLGIRTLSESELQALVLRYS